MSEAQCDTDAKVGGVLLTIGYNLVGPDQIEVIDAIDEDGREVALTPAQRKRLEKSIPRDPIFAIHHGADL